MRLWGAGEALREAIQVPLAPDERARFEAAMAVVRGSLGEQAFLASWSEGRRMTWEQAMALARAE